MNAIESSSICPDCGGYVDHISMMCIICWRENKAWPSKEAHSLEESAHRDFFVTGLFRW